LLSDAKVFDETCVGNDLVSVNTENAHNQRTKFGEDIVCSAKLELLGREGNTHEFNGNVAKCNPFFGRHTPEWNRDDVQQENAKGSQRKSHRQNANVDRYRSNQGEAKQGNDRGPKYLTE